MRGKPYGKQKIKDALRACKGLVYLAAKKLGCNPSTIHRAKQKYPDVKAICEQERGEIVDTGELALLKAVQAGEAWAVCFLLKTQAKDRGYFEKGIIQHEGSESQPIVFRTVSVVRPVEAANLNGHASNGHH